MTATVTSFGDYDQCLNVRGPHHDGSHCMVQLRMNVDNEPTQVGDLLNQTLPKLGHFYLIQGLCMPSSCSHDEIRSIVSKTLESFPLLTVQEQFKCDTRLSTSYDTRLNQLSKSQFVSL